MKTKSKPIDERLEAVGVAAAHLMAAAFGSSVDDIFSPTRGKAEALLVRQFAIYLVNASVGLSPGDTGKALRRDRTTVCHTMSMVEALRDEDADVDALLTELGELMSRVVRLRSLMMSPLPTPAVGLSA